MSRKDSGRLMFRKLTGLPTAAKLFINHSLSEIDSILSAQYHTRHQASVWASGCMLGAASHMANLCPAACFGIVHSSD